MGADLCLEIFVVVHGAARRALLVALLLDRVEAQQTHLLSGADFSVLNLRTTTSQKCEVVPRGLVFKDHRLLFHSNLGSRVIKKKKKQTERERAWLTISAGVLKSPSFAGAVPSTSVPSITLARQATPSKTLRARNEESPAVERTWHTQDSHGQTLALAFR